MRRDIYFACVIALSFAAVHAAKAATIEYTSPSAFAAAAKGLTTYGFPAPPPGYFFTVVSNPYTVGPISFSNVDENYLLRLGYVNPYLEMTAGNTGLFTISPGATAVAFDLATPYAPASFTLAVNGVTVGLWGTSKTQTSTFLGLISDVPITSVRLVSPMDSVGLDVLDFQVGSAAAAASAVPEPMPISLVCTALLGCGAAVRRRFIQAASPHSRAVSRP